MTAYFRNLKALLIALVIFTVVALGIGYWQKWDMTWMWALIVAAVSLTSAVFSAAASLASAQTAQAAEKRSATADRARLERDYWMAYSRTLAEKPHLHDLGIQLKRTRATLAMHAGSFGNDRQKAVEADVDKSLGMLDNLHEEAAPLLPARIGDVATMTDAALWTALASAEGLSAFHSTFREKALRDIATYEDEIRQLRDDKRHPP